MTTDKKQTTNLYFFFFNDTATTEIYTLSLHDALPPWSSRSCPTVTSAPSPKATAIWASSSPRSEEPPSELPSRRDLVCRLLLEKKNTRGSALRIGPCNDPSREYRRPGS